MGKKGPVWMSMGIVLLTIGIAGYAYHFLRRTCDMRMVSFDVVACGPSYWITIKPYQFEGLFAIVAGIVLIGIGSIYFIRNTGKAKTQ